MAETTTNWVTFLASNDRRGGAAAVRTSGLKELIWKVTLPESVRSSPVLRDGVLYVTCRNGILYALDSRGGKERWTYQAGDALRSTPSLSGNLVLFGGDDGAVYAVDRTAGRLVVEDGDRWSGLDVARRARRRRVLRIDERRVRLDGARHRQGALEARFRRADPVDGLRDREDGLFRLRQRQALRARSRDRARTSGRTRRTMASRARRW